MGEVSPEERERLRAAWSHATENFHTERNLREKVEEAVREHRKLFTQRAPADVQHHAVDKKLWQTVSGDTE